MKELLKKSTAALLTLVMLIATVTMLPITASAAGDSIATATTYTFGNTVNDSVTATQYSDFYKLNLPKSGAIHIKATMYIEDGMINIYNSDGENVWDKDYNWNSSTKMCSVDDTVHLTSGTYYFEIGTRFVSNGMNSKYNFKINYVESGESFQESGWGTNNELYSAHNITTGKNYYGQIASNDDKDTYSFSLSASGKINIALDAYIEETSYYLYDSEGNTVWDSRYRDWNSTSKKFTLNEDIHLTAGTYYFSVVRYSGYGNYNFIIKYTSANESFKETSWGINNEINSASKISLNKSYKGQIAHNDDRDFYTFTLSTSGKINIALNAYIKETSYYLYDSEGNTVWDSIYRDWNSTSKKLTLNENVHLTAGTYYFSVVGRLGYGNYNFNIKFTSANESFKETSWGTNNDISNTSKITLGKLYKGQIANNDEKDFYSFTVTKSGLFSISLEAYIPYTSYYLYDKDGNEIWNSRWRSWDDTSKKLVLYETFNLAKGTYYFCVSMTSGCGNYSLMISKMIPSPSILTRYTSNVTKGITLKWLAVDSVSGYYIYRKASNETKWTLISTIKNSSTTSYTDKNVKSGTTYQYAMKAYEGSSISSLGSAISIKRLANPSLKSAVNATSGLKVTWGKVAGASGYYVYRKAGSAKSWTKIATVKGTSATSYTDTKTKSGTIYTYTVRAYYGSTMSSFNSTGIKTKRLVNPVISSLSNATSGISVKWGKVTGATGYQVYRKASGETSWTLIGTIKNASTTGFTDKKVKSGTSYRYTIRAYNGSIKSSYYNGSVIKRLANPTVKSVANAGKGIKVTWGKVTGAGGYYVYRKVNSATKWVLVATVKGGSVTSFTDTKVTSGNNYRYTVRAYSGSVKSSYNNGAITKRLANPPLKSATNTTYGINLTWGKVTGAKGYQVYRKAGNAKTWTLVANVKGGSKVTYLDKNVKSGVRYCYTVRAYYNSSIKSSFYTGIYRTR